MFSQKAKKHADACRYCWMCRHLCPIGLKTGKEINTPRAKGLLVAMNERGFPMDSSAAEAMYECLLCGLCTNDCVTGFDPLIFIREARTEAVVNNLVPPYVRKVIDRILETGNPFGLPAKKKWDALKDEVATLPDQADVLLYVGNTAAYRTPEIAKAVMSLLKKAGISFTVLQNELSSGIELGDLIGFVEEVRTMAKACAAAINKIGPKTVVVLDTYDAACFKHEYQEWNCKIEADVVTATAFIAELVRNSKLVIEKRNTVVTYHDSARLARDLGEHEPARELIAATGATLKEMFLNRRLAKCCGSELVNQYRPDLTRLTAESRWEDAIRTGAKALITACPQAYDVLAKAIPTEMELIDLFRLLDESTNQDK
ncbi:MAG TPA: (Fe-S)-binding protein [Bacillota bacterium]